MLRWFLLFFASTSFAQLHYDTIVDKGIYKSYFNTKLKQPVAVKYSLYKGGGKAKRDNDHFVGTSLTLHDKDYVHSGYDRGHLVPAEDFAYNDSLQALTFSYYNCVPQVPKLNRGPWKKYETKVRKLSQKDTLVIVCINQYKYTYLDHVNIPEACYKFIFSTNGKCILSIGLTNGIATAGQEIEVTDKLKKEAENLMHNH
jgi:endonuclease G